MLDVCCLGDTPLIFLMIQFVRCDKVWIEKILKYIIFCKKINVIAM